MNELLTKDNKPPDLANSVKHGTIKEEIFAKIDLLSDKECAEVLAILKARNLV